MTTLNITLSDELSARLRSRAVESGFDRIEDYVQSLLNAEVSDDLTEDEELEQLLLRRIDDPRQVELTPGFVDEFKRQVTQRRKLGKSRK
jgi:hypothetical protein